MKLDRNINDGTGKYALVNLRKFELPHNAKRLKQLEVPRRAITWGGKDQFFVIKYKDKFAAPALMAYAMAVHAEADRLHNAASKTKDSDRATSLYCRSRDLREWAEEMENESRCAEDWRGKRIPD